MEKLFNTKNLDFMKRLFFYLLFVIPSGLFAQTAKIKIDIDRTIGEIDPRIYGVFMEPIHFNGRRMGLPDSVEFNTLYGNLYDPSSPLADENGFRKDYIDAMRELKVINMQKKFRQKIIKSVAHFRHIRLRKSKLK